MWLRLRNVEGKKKICPFFLLENSRPLSPWGPLDFLSTCLGNDSLKVMGPDAMIFIFWMLSFKPTFSLSYFTFIKRLFSSTLSAIRVVSSAYLKLLIFLPAILILACASSNPAFLMMYFAYKLNKQGDTIQPWRTPFPIWNQSGCQIKMTVLSY